MHSFLEEIDISSLLFRLQQVGTKRWVQVAIHGLYLWRVTWEWAMLGGGKFGEGGGKLFKLHGGSLRVVYNDICLYLFQPFSVPVFPFLFFFFYLLSFCHPITPILPFSFFPSFSVCLLSFYVAFRSEKNCLRHHPRQLGSVRVY